MSHEFYDILEARSAEAREAALMAALPEQIDLAQRRCPAYRRLLDGIDPAQIASRDALAGLPVTRKADLVALQRADPPFGGLAAAAPGRMLRLFASPGPIFEPQGHGPDYWRFARALWAAGLRAGDVLHNCFAYHFTPAGAMMEAAAHAIGAAVFPAGTGQSEQQVEAIAAIGPCCYAGTPDFLRAILEKADAMGRDLSCLRLAHVSGGALLPDAKAYYQARGIAVTQSYGTADLGMVAYESQARDGLILDEHVIVEIVRPGTGAPVADGEVGEVVVTTFSRDYPLIRFATGDLSALMPGPSPCGRTNRRIRGWLGRADQTTKVKGMFVQPGQVAEVLRRHAGTGRGRLVVEREAGSDVMTLQVECALPEPGLAEALAETLQAVTKLRGGISLVAPGSLPNDGKVIDDQRRYAAEGA